MNHTLAGMLMNFYSVLSSPVTVKLNDFSDPRLEPSQFYTTIFFLTTSQNHIKLREKGMFSCMTKVIVETT